MLVNRIHCRIAIIAIYQHILYTIQYSYIISLAIYPRINNCCQVAQSQGLDMATSARPSYSSSLSAPAGLEDAAGRAMSSTPRQRHAARPFLRSRGALKAISRPTRGMPSRYGETEVLIYVISSLM